MFYEASEALVLRTTDYGESDRVVQLLTAVNGLCSGFAPGARNSRRRFGPALQPLSHVRIYWQRSRPGHLRQLKQADLLVSPRRLLPRLQAWALGVYGCELVLNLFAEEDPQPALFELMLAYGDALADGTPLAEARLLFELRLLALAGLLPHLGHCAQCGTLAGGPQRVFDSRRGGALCLACASGVEPLRVAALSLGSLARLARLDLCRFAGVRLSGATLREGHAVLGQVLGQVLPRSMKTPPFIDLFAACDRRGDLHLDSSG
ncbi:MAG: DNA repair protein RecO [Desulfuromonas sp.]|nr:DNA repair protein RecO [Desulfuromonas thiophila]MDY0397111.1 DNA repair protein RecO [Desulfuromonas thiophila]